jgi:hypothetical protein
LGGIGAAGHVLFLRWGRPRQALQTALWAYGVAALFRVMLWGAFLPHGDDRFMVLWRILSLQALPPYDAFIGLIFILGPLLIILVGLGLHQVFSAWGVYYPLDNRVIDRPLWASMGLMPLLLLSLVLARTARIDPGTAELSLVSTEWLIAPTVNLVLVAFMGLAVGWSWICPDRFSAALTLAIGACGHVFLMFLIEPVLASYDPFHTPINMNQVPAGQFLFFWVGVPLFGAMAAFAGHSLRDALLMEEVVSN